MKTMTRARTEHYMPLDRHEDEIRLLSFNKARGGAIRGRLHVFPLSKCPEYIAISYVWGEEPPRRTMYLNGNRFRLRNNIYQAVKAILRLRARNRDSDQVRQSTPQVLDLPKMLAQNEYFWIDSICIDQTCVQERTQQVCLMDKIFSHAQFVVAWLWPSSKGSIEVMQSIRNYEPPHKIVDFSISHVLFPENLQLSIESFGRLEYWSRTWIIQELVLAKDILVFWGDESLSWNTLKDLVLGCAMFLGAPLKHALYQHVNQDTLEQMPFWMRIVLLKEQRTSALQNREVPHGGSNGDGDGKRDGTFPNLYSLISSCVNHSCKEPRDKVISLLGLIPGTSHLVDYSTPIDQYFEKVCEYTFSEACITDFFIKSNFRELLGYYLGLRYAHYRAFEVVWPPAFHHGFTKRQFLAFRNTNIPYALPRDVRVLSELVYYD